MNAYEQISDYASLKNTYERSVFTAFDTETTGLRSAADRIIEIGAVQFDARGIRARFSVLVNPLRPTPVAIQKITGITDAMLFDKPAISAVLPDFMNFIGSSILIAHNAPFDVGFINAELSRMRLAALKNSWIDTRKFAKESFPDKKSFKLQNLAADLSIAVRAAHRAEDDARVCMELFLRCMQKVRQTPV